jgi:hypothetical protein
MPNCYRHHRLDDVLFVLALAVPAAVAAQRFVEMRQEMAAGELARGAQPTGVAKTSDAAKKRHATAEGRLVLAAFSMR